MTQKIMIIDDEPDILLYLTMVLEDSGYRVCTVNEGEPAEKAVEEHAPDLIVLDIMMPIRSGLSIYTELKTSERFRNIPVILISGFSTEKEFMAHDFQMLVNDTTLPPPDGFIEKPLQLKKLIRLTQKLLDEGSP
jgi:CheY-like chemotaxis protein